MDDFFCYAIDVLFDRQLDDPAFIEACEAANDEGEGKQVDDACDSPQKAA